jgi:hypothetical protein
MSYFCIRVCVYVCFHVHVRTHIHAHVSVQLKWAWTSFMLISMFIHHEPLGEHGHLFENNFLYQMSD